MKKFGIGVVTAVAVASLTVGVVASDLVENISAELRKDLTVVIDGRTQSFTDANGQTVYPIMYNGTTYLPLRAIGGVMGKPVAWDGETGKVTLGEKDAYRSIVAMPDKGSSAFGYKTIDKTKLTFPYGELKEDKSYENAIVLEDINSAQKEISLKLDDAYALLRVTLHNPKTSENAVKAVIKDNKTDIVLLTQTLEPGQFFEATDVNLNSTSEIEFSATGVAGSSDTVYFLEPQVK